MSESIAPAHSIQLERLERKMKHSELLRELEAKIMKLSSEELTHLIQECKYELIERRDLKGRE